jgi:glycosyltransferase involved in cell wall biosynthesis
VSRHRVLKVAYVVPDLGIGGAERHVTTLMSHLDRERFDPMVICLGRQGQLFASLAASDVPAVALGRRKRQAFACLIDLVRKLREFSPDVVVVRGYNAEVLGRVAAVLAGVPSLIVWVHNCGDLRPRGALRRICDAALDRVTNAYFGVAHAQVPYLVRELRFPSRKIRIIHNGVDLSSFPATTDRDLRNQFGFQTHEVVVGVLAALRPEKDHETFLRAASLISKRDPRARFLIVGDGPRRAALEVLAEDLGIRDRVLFTGPRNDVAAVLAVMDIFVLTSFTIECFPMALLEAMASSRPAVCTAVGGVPELLSDGVTGYLVPPRDPIALADRLSSLLESSQRRRQFGAAARARVEAEFTLERSVREAERQISEVAATHPGPVAGAPIRLALVLDETFVGGVELLMLDVFKNFDPGVVKPILICLRKAGPLAADYRAAGFRVEVLGRRGKFDPRTLPRLMKALRQEEIDAVLVTHHHRASLAFGRLAARLSGVPVNLVAAHDMDLTRIGKRCLPRWTVATLRASDALVLLSPSQGEYLHREEQVGRQPWSRTKEIVIPNGVMVRPLPDPSERAAARARLGLSADHFVVGIVARLSAQKAHHVLFEAFARLREGHPHARLVVVGGGDREMELRILAARLGLDGSVVFTGVRRDVPALLPAFDVSCLSSIHEGVPMAAIESMAVGIPMVVTDCGALRDMIVDGKQGFIVPVGDSPAMADRLLTLADDSKLRERLGESAQSRVQRMYRIEQTARGYEDLLVDLVGARCDVGAGYRGWQRLKRRSAMIDS